MKRLLRTLLNAATVLSLVLWVATMAAWVRSYRVRDMLLLSLGNPRMQLELATYRGGLFAVVMTPVVSIEYYLRPPGASWDQAAPLSYSHASGPLRTFLNQFGFALNYFPNDAYVLRQLACPYWFIMLLTAILPAARLAGCRRRSRQVRIHPSLCRRCGYDCRATPDRCPECGTVAAGDR